MKTLPSKSKGHLFFVKVSWAPITYEYFEQENYICRAPIENVIMPDGYRCGRFECYKSAFNKDQLAAIMSKVHEVF